MLPLQIGCQKRGWFGSLPMITFRTYGYRCITFTA